ncbi:hypothetical protein [Thermomonospora umbrina]|uniref:Uncharacterized protein n=1 Tax=Thermomonospora umbrina TaxID=111806 RepID=A0A3D9SMS0_9ACTN|nr:hypothetical protein [Thermomonospora umbrina]REE97226.1 hypothetical protein DFJ69_2690 [Thermomonospora umbrina]
MDAFGIGLIAALLLLGVMGAWPALEGLLPHLADSRDWPNEVRARRIRRMRLTVGLTALTLIAVPIAWGTLLP